MRYQEEKSIDVLMAEDLMGYARETSFPPLMTEEKQEELLSGLKEVQGPGYSGKIDPNPFTTMLIGGVIAGAAYLLYKHFNKESSAANQTIFKRRKRKLKAIQLTSFDAVEDQNEIIAKEDTDFEGEQEGSQVITVGKVGAAVGAIAGGALIGNHERVQYYRRRATCGLFYPAFQSQYRLNGTYRHAYKRLP